MTDKKKLAAAVELGRRSAALRMETMTPEQRSELGRKAGIASGKKRRENKRKKNLDN